MIMFSEQFLEQGSFEINYKGKIVNAFYTFDKKGTYRFKFSFISVASLYKQAIIVHLDTFKGKLFIDGKEIKKPKGKFPQLIFDEKAMPKQFDIEVVLLEGSLIISNGYCDTQVLGVWDSLYGGCAMIIERLVDNKFRFYCNDFENDDDFDDLIFDMEIIEEGKI